MKLVFFVKSFKNVAQLQKKQIVDKTGRHTTVYVAGEKPAAAKQEAQPKQIKGYPAGSHLGPLHKQADGFWYEETKKVTDDDGKAMDYVKRRHESTTQKQGTQPEVGHKVRTGEPV